jgi:predicted aldo/keto reductase-like oxidoreductase
MKKLGFGLMRLPLKNANDQSDIDIEQFKQMADLFISRGFTYFDTAYPYHNGQSEIAFREAVAKRFPRTAYTITDKMPCWEVNESKDLERIFNEQLKKCGVDYFDYYWLHSMNRSYYENMQRNKGFEFIAQKKDEGKILHIGFSFHDDVSLLEQILTEHPEVEFVQLQINYMDWNDPSIQSRKCYETCVRHGKKVIVMEPVKGGMLARVPENVKQLFSEHNPQASIASWAIRYAASLPNVMVVLSGMSDMAQMEDNSSYMKEFKSLDDSEKNLISKARKTIHDSIAIPCTACHYCTDGCPQHICIPEYFALYNDVKQYGGNTFNLHFYYGLKTATNGKASSCIQCGQCQEHCPQHLPIIENLKLVAKMFE